MHIPQAVGPSVIKTVVMDSVERVHLPSRTIRVLERPHHRLTIFQELQERFRQPPTNHNILFLDPRGKLHRLHGKNRGQDDSNESRGYGGKTGGKSSEEKKKKSTNDSIETKNKFTKGK